MEYAKNSNPYMYGGNSFNAVGTMAAWKGPVSNDKVPLNCYNQKNPNEDMRWEADYHLQDAFLIPGIISEDDKEHKTSTELTKQLIMSEGALEVSFSASDDYLNKETNAFYCSNEDAIADHTVVLAGWDNNYPKENFLEGKQPKNDGAWLIRNSWDTDVGEDGYYWLSYEDKSIDIVAQYFLEENDNYTKNYQYDTMGWVFAMSTSEDEEASKTAKVANIFTAESDEMLEAVSFYTTDAGAEYTISVYTDVEKNEPESGELQIIQSGAETYAGYHTIELSQAVKLEKGKCFSIVIEVTNPEYTSPLAIEGYLLPTPDAVPQYLGNGGESYAYYVGDDGEFGWYDIAGPLDNTVYTTNVCIKGFTNPLPDEGEPVSTVRFSEMAGPVRDNSEITLYAEGGEDIYYSIDGENIQKYISPIKMDFSNTDNHTISAYAVNKNGKKGNLVSKEYTHAIAQLTDLALNIDSNSYIHIDTELTEYVTCLDNSVDNFQVMAQSGDTITVNGEKINSNDWSKTISIAVDDIKEIDFEISGEGKRSSTHHLTIYRNAIDFDYTAETIIFDDTRYIIKDKNGTEIHNGDCITSLISTDKSTDLQVIDTYTNRTYLNRIPGQQSIVGTIDYESETTAGAYSDNYYYSKNSDMSDKVQCEYGQYIPLTPGEDIYIQRASTEYSFASEIFHLEVPARPVAPNVIAEEITETSVTLQEIEDAVYSIDGEWQKSPKFTDLIPGKEYRFEVRILSTDKSFCSETGSASFTTKSPEVTASDYSFEVRYVDVDGNSVEGGGTITFNNTGGYSRADIPLPYGYMQVVPAHPDDDWMYPTALELIDGVWTFTNPVVEIMVEPKASVTFIFKTPDGKALEDLDYIKYYDSEGEQIETITAPDGYEFVGDNTYTIDIKRNKNGGLTANPNKVILTVKAIGSQKPTEPTNPEKPQKPTGNDKPQTGTKPQNPNTSTDINSVATGDATNMTLLLTFLLLFSGTATVLTVRKRKNRN